MLNQHPGRQVTRILTLFLLWSAISGCANKPLDQAEKMIENYDFLLAVEYLSSIHDDDVDQIRYRELVAQASVINGQTDAGFEEIRIIEAATGDVSKPRRKTATLIFQAATLIIREKHRVAEAISLFDSVLVRDPSLQEDVLDLVWYRALEYLEVSGDGGYRLIEFALKHDTNVLGRLRGFNRSLANRYDEINRVKQQLAKLDGSLQRFKKWNGRDPENLAGLATFAPTLATDTLRKGWRFRLEPRAGSSVVVAEALVHNPQGVIRGTILEAP